MEVGSNQAAPLQGYNEQIIFTWFPSKEVTLKNILHFP